MRPGFQWEIGRRSLPLGERTLVMGVLNVTPDSFSDGGAYSASDAAIAHGLALLDEGADILDIGGESTRPGVHTGGTQTLGLAGAVSAEEEIGRVLPVIEAIKRERPDSVLSIDTYKSTVALAAIEAGVEIVNDVSGFTWDSAMSSTVAGHPCGAVLMHVRGRPHEWRALASAPDIVALVCEELRERLGAALDAGVLGRRIVVDPGFGFGKNYDENYPLLAGFAKFHALGYPLLAGVSRKSFLGRTVAERLAKIAARKIDNGCPQNSVTLPPAGRDIASVAASVAAVLAGAHVVRVHAVAATVEAVAIADAILRVQSST
ncbi:MAG: dihydropteroate synthase [Candidatus Korobacteraceae bacterium]|jgi:dihydropteroate synthase